MVQQEVLEVSAAAVHHACAANVTLVLLAVALALATNVSTTYGIIHAVVAYVLPQHLINQNGVLHIQHLYKVVEDRCPDNHSSAEARPMNVHTVYGNQETVAPVALATL